jgi:hypothetical protein
MGKKSNRSVLTEFNNSSTNLFKLPTNVDQQNILNEIYSKNPMASIHVSNMDRNKQSKGSKGLTLDELRKKQQDIHKMQK